MSASKKRGLQTRPRVRVPSKGEGADQSHPVADQIARDDAALLVPLGRIEIRPGQPRKTFDEESISELAENIRVNGVIHPLVVTQEGKMYGLVAGERRLRALQLLGASDAPVRVVDEKQARAIQLAENIHREDLPLIEEAQALAALREEQGLTVRELADTVKKSRSYVQRRLEILEWPEDTQELLRTHPGMLTQAAELAKISDPQERERRIAAALRPEGAAVPEEPVDKKRGRGRPPTPFKFAERRDGGFDLQVRYRPGMTNREELVNQLKELLRALEGSE